MQEPPAGADGAAAGRPPHRTAKKTSLFRGVATTEAATWRARIRFGRATVNLGRYRVEKDAALAYDRAAAMLYGPSAVLNLRDEPCCDPAAAIHTAALIQQALRDDTPTAVKQLVEGAPLLHGRVGVCGGAPRGERDSAEPLAPPAAPLGLQGSLMRSPPPRRATQLSPQARSLTRLVGDGGATGPQVGGSGRGPSAADLWQLFLRPCQERVEPAAVNAAADGRGAAPESGADTGSGLSSPSASDMRLQGLALAGCDAPEQQATSGGPPAALDECRCTRVAEFAGALECICQLLHSDPGLLTSYFEGVLPQTAAALRPQGWEGPAADAGAAAAAATVAPAAAAAAPVPAPASPPRPPPLVQLHERPAAEGERPQQRPRLEGGSPRRGAGCGARAPVTLALRPLPALLPAPLAPPPEAAALASGASGILRAALLAYLGRALSS